jgi:hypothetical protein
MLAGGKQNRGAAVPEIVDADARQVCGFQEYVELPPNVPLVESGSDRTREDVARLPPA